MYYLEIVDKGTFEELHMGYYDNLDELKQKVDQYWNVISEVWLGDKLLQTRYQYDGYNNSWHI